MVVIPGLSQPLEAVGKLITSWDNSSARLAIEADSIVRQAACPRCACSSARSHGRYRRRIADSPCFGQPVTLEVETRRFKCVNHGGPQRTFFKPNFHRTWNVTLRPPLTVLSLSWR